MIDPSNPIPALIGCTVWLPVVIWLYVLVGGALMGEIDGFSALIGVSLVFGGAIWVSANPGHPQVGYAIIGMFSSIVAFPFVQAFHSKRQLQWLDIEQVERAYEQLSLRPNAVGPVFRICGVAYRRGAPEHAVAAAERAATALPKNLAMDELRQVRLWKAGMTARPGLTIPCVECGFRIPPGGVHCPGCGAPFMLAFARGQLVSTRGAKRLASVWVASTLGLVALPVVTTLTDPNLQRVVYATVLVLAAALVALTFYRTQGDA